MIDYCARYGLETNPFLNNSKEITVETAEYKEALYRLRQLEKTKGFGVLTGSPGRGKTTTLRKWSDSLNPSLYKVVYTNFTTLTVNEFCRELVMTLGMQPSHRKNMNFRLIRDEVTRQVLEKRKTPVIIIDEANAMQSSALTDLQLIFNFEMDSRDRAIVILAGLPKLNAMLRLNSHEPLAQRVIMNYNLEGLSKIEGKAYIEQKLSGAGCHQQVFEDAAVEAVLNASDGTPRLINKLCNAALMLGSSLQRATINSDIVLQAINDCELA